MKIAILTTNFGKSFVFLEQFYHYANKNFLLDCKKDFFIFTDAQKVNLRMRNSNVNVINCKNGEWPKNSLFKFNMFIKHDIKLLNYDYIFFLNTNVLIKKPVYSYDILTGENYIFAIHPYYSLINDEALLPFDRNPHSASFVQHGNKNATTYISNMLFGGKAWAFLNLCKECNKNIKMDLLNNVDALWYDESHLNKFYINIKEQETIKLLPPAFLWSPDIINSVDKSDLIGYIISELPYGGSNKINVALNKNEISDIKFSDNFVVKEIFVKENENTELIKLDKYVCYAPYSQREGIVAEMKDLEIKIIWNDAGLSVYKYDSSINCYK